MRLEARPGGPTNIRLFAPSSRRRPSRAPFLFNQSQILQRNYAIKHCDKRPLSRCAPPSSDYDARGHLSMVELCNSAPVISGGICAMVRNGRHTAWRRPVQFHPGMGPEQGLSARARVRLDRGTLSCSNNRHRLAARCPFQWVTREMGIFHFASERVMWGCHEGRPLRRSHDTVGRRPVWALLSRRGVPLAQRTTNPTDRRRVAPYLDRAPRNRNNGQLRRGGAQLSRLSAMTTSQTVTLSTNHAATQSTFG